MTNTIVIACGGNIFELKSFKCQHLLPINIDNTHTCTDEKKTLTSMIRREFEPLYLVPEIYMGKLKYCSHTHTHTHARRHMGAKSFTAPFFFFNFGNNNSLTFLLECSELVENQKILQPN